MNPQRDTQRTILIRGGFALRVWISFVVCAGLVVSGCSIFKVDADKARQNILEKAFSKKEKPKSKSSRTGADSISSESEIGLTGGLSLGDTDNLAFTTAELGDLLSQFLEADKWNSTRSLIRLYPDLVGKILIGDRHGSLSEAQLIKVAELYDDQWAGNGDDSWLTFIRDQQKDTNGQFSDLRKRFLKHLENDESEKALSLKFSRTLRGSSSSIARAEAHRLEGVAHMMNEDHQRSGEHFAKATELLKQTHPHAASHHALLLGESQRHAGEKDQWISTWKFAIDLQSRWLAERGLHDPAFWKQAAYLRPAETPWPIKVIGRLENALRNENLDFGANQTADVEAVVWATVGTQSLKRHESQNAILAFKKSESLVASSSLKEELRMQQALAMINGGQQGPASAILVRLSSKPGLLGDRAKAVLATMKLQNGSLIQGMNLLQSAIKSSNQWPTSERLRAMADYGLAYLMREKEEQGIALLNSVHSEFVKEKSFGHAAQCLENMATYYEKTDQNGLRRQVVARMKRLESY